MILTKTSWSSTSGGTGLLDTLQSDDIDTVLVCGLITSVCVQHSAFGVFEAGYRTILVTDACADRGKERHEAALALYGDYMYELRNIDSVQAELKGDCACSGERDTIVKSKSDGSLSSVTSHANSISTVERYDDDDEEEVPE